MSSISILKTGYGQCTVSNYSPADGEEFTIYALADLHNSILDLYATEQHGYVIALYLIPEQTLTYDASWGDVVITCNFSQRHYIDLIISGEGSGHAYVSNEYPEPDEVISLTAYATDRKSELLSIEATDENGDIIPSIITLPYQTFTFNEDWGNITITVTFDIKWLFKNLWILSRREWWRKNNY